MATTMGYEAVNVFLGLITLAALAGFGFHLIPELSSNPKFWDGLVFVALIIWYVANHLLHASRMMFSLISSSSRSTADQPAE